MKPDLEKYLERLMKLEQIVGERLPASKSITNPYPIEYAKVVTAICDVLREMRECRSQSDRGAAKRQREAMGHPS